MGDPVSTAMTWTGGPYQFGANGTKPGEAVDCSRFVQEVYAANGVSLPRDTWGQMKVGTAVASIKDAVPGDLLFYNGGSHVGIYIGNNKVVQALGAKWGVGVWDVSFAGTVTSIRRVAGGSKAASAASSGAGKAGVSTTGSSATSNLGSSVGTSLANSFISKAGGSWLSGSGLAMLGSGGKSSGSQSQSGSSGVGGTGGTGSTTAVGGAVADNSIKTPTQFSLAVLRGLGVSPSTADVLAVNEWQQHEGQWTVRGGDNPYYAPNMHNPLNTKLQMPGSVDLGGETRSFKTWADGVSASVSTIKQKNMSAILTALKGNADLKTFGAALESTPWAASSYGGADFAKPSGVYAMGDPSGSSHMAPAPSMRHSSSTVLPSARGSGGTINLSMPIQMVNGSQQDATRLVSMVVQELQKQTGMSAVSGI